MIGTTLAHYEILSKLGEGGPRGDRLYYDEEERIMEVTVETAGDAIRLGRPTFLFDLPSEDFTPAPDGERFLVVARPQQDGDAGEGRIGIKIVSDWVREFRKK